MAQIVTITNPLTGQPTQVDQLDHTAQQIDDAIARALPGGAIDLEKAPAGYGLGTAPKKITDWNDAKLDGWYCSDAGALNSPDSNMWFFGIVHNANNPEVFVQEVWHFPNVDKVYHWQRFYYPGVGNGTPWEWVDPPMALGVEYRTTERYQGKPVYVKAFNTGALGQNVVDDVFVDTPNADNIWVSSGTFINTSGGGATPTSIPYHASADDNIVFASAYSGVIHRVYKGSAFTITNMIVVLKYTKSTD